MRILTSPFMVSLLVVGSALVAGCGGDESGTPLRSGALTAEYAGTVFTPVNGFATIYKDKPLIGLGDGPLHCGSETSPEPPSGRNALFSVPLEVGTYSNVLVNLIENVSSYHGAGANQGRVTITSVTADSIAGTVSFDYTADDTKHYAISGDFDIVRCKP